MIVYRMSIPFSREPGPTFKSRRALKAFYRIFAGWSKREVDVHEIIEEETGVQKLTEVAK